MFSMDSASGDITGRGTLSAYIDIEMTSWISVEHTAGKLLRRMAILDRHVFLGAKTALNDLFYSSSSFSKCTQLLSVDSPDES
jgi:hypothetical protein